MSIDILVLNGDDFLLTNLSSFFSHLRIMGRVLLLRGVSMARLSLRLAFLSLLPLSVVAREVAVLAQTFSIMDFVRVDARPGLLGSDAA